jgi:hypothetical protein
LQWFQSGAPEVSTHLPAPSRRQTDRQAERQADSKQTETETRHTGRDAKK